VAAHQFAARIEAELAEPFLLDVGPVKIGASVGVAVSDPSSTVVSLLADADVQMYDAKSRRRGLAARPSAQRRLGAIERRRLADELTAGIGRGEVVAYLQPIVDLDSDALVGMEALARWNHPTLGLLAPGAFIDLVEDAGLDVPFGDAVLESAASVMGDLARNPATAGGGFTLAVNLSIGQLSHLGLAARIGGVLDAHGMAMQDLVVEITERATLARHASLGSSSPDAALRELHAAGAALSLDDFGTGHSSLTHVRRFPLASVKIDQTFVAGMCEHAEDLAVVNVVIGLCKALGLDVVAEGIETAEQRRLLLSLGCRLGQGFAISPPLPPDTVADWVSRHRR
jgi:EAL domain-containing protein (putative c-di-GMP-specific phosphodiesterase class I)